MANKWKLSEEKDLLRFRHTAIPFSLVSALGLMRQEGSKETGRGRERFNVYNRHISSRGRKFMDAKVSRYLYRETLVDAIPLLTALQSALGQLDRTE